MVHGFPNVAPGSGCNKVALRRDVEWEPRGKLFGCKRRLEGIKRGSPIVADDELGRGIDVAGNRREGQHKGNQKAHEPSVGCRLERFWNGAFQQTLSCRIPGRGPA